MFAVICSEIFYDSIKTAIDSTGEQIIINNIGNDIDLSEEFNRTYNVSEAIKYFILDISSVSDPKSLPSYVRNFRIRQDSTTFIIIAPNCQPGNPIVAELVRIGIYDILSPELPVDMSKDNVKEYKEKYLDPLFKEAIGAAPKRYRDAVRWDKDFIQSEQNKEKPKSVIKKEIIREIKYKPSKTIIESNFLGSVLIAVAGDAVNVGCTHAAIQIAFFLSRHVKNFKVAVAQHNDTQAFQYLSKLGLGKALSEKSFTYKNVDFYYDTPMLEIKKMDFYDYIILDIGLIKSQGKSNEFIKSEYFDMMHWADLPILVCSSKPWEYEEITISLFDDSEMDTCKETRDWKLLFNLTDDDFFDYVKGDLKYTWDVYKMPFSPNLFQQYPELDTVFTELLQPVLPKKDVIEEKK